MLWASPISTGVAILSLALGIGANTAIFSWTQTFLFRPLPGVAQPDDIVVLVEQSPSGYYESFSYPNFVDYRADPSLAGAFLNEVTPINLTSGDRAERLFGCLVSGNYFDVLGVTPILGRRFTPDEDETLSSHPVTILGYGLWVRRFGRDPAIIGKTVMLNGYPFTVVGVAPEAFGGTLVGVSMDLWVPSMMHPEILSGGSLLSARGVHWSKAMARLRPGVTVARARASLTVVAHQLEREYPSTNRGRRIDVLPVWASPWGTQRFVRPFAPILGAVVLLILLLVCANVANMLLARGLARQREIAVRAALGAKRGRIVRQLLTESVLLALLGGTAGLALAYWTNDLLVWSMPSSSLPINQAVIVLDYRTLVFTATVSLVTGFFFGLTPALAASKPDLVETLKDEAGAVQGASGSSLRNVLVVAQVALAVLLLVASGLFLRSLREEQHVDPGFNPTHLLLGGYGLPSSGYTAVRGKQFHEQLLGRAKALAGVIDATVAHRVPLDLRGRASMVVAIEGYAPRIEEDMSVEVNIVGPRYFRVMDIPLVDGRDFLSSDRDGSPVAVVVNEAMAAHFWQGRDPVGASMTVAGKRARVIAVAKNSKFHDLVETPAPFMYLSALQWYRPDMVVQVRTASDPASIVAALRREVADLDPNLPLYNTITLEQQMDVALFSQRTVVTLLGLFGTLALTLAALGLYGVMSYLVGRRTREMGVRLALGAQPGDLVNMILRSGLGLTAAGLVLGVIVSVMAMQVMRERLYGISAVDPLTFVTVAALLLIVGAVASYFPGRRASRVDPLVALRYE
jgi:putative ABC transport system permease protein